MPSAEPPLTVSTPIPFATPSWPPTTFSSRWVSPGCRVTWNGAVGTAEAPMPVNVTSAVDTRVPMFDSRRSLRQRLLLGPGALSTPSR